MSEEKEIIFRKPGRVFTVDDVNPEAFLRCTLHFQLDTLVQEIIDAENNMVLEHFETDMHELRDYLDARRRGAELVEVVRCEACRYGSRLPWNDVGDRWCCKHNGHVNDNFFCADGERKEQNNG